MTIDELDRKTGAGFKDVRAEIKDLRAEMRAGFRQADDNLQGGLQGVRTEIKAEGEITRRHFDVVAEQFKEYTKLLTDGIVRNTEPLDEHDRRITALEGGQ
jgi:hypothetical protein